MNKITFNELPNAVGGLYEKLDNIEEILRSMHKTKGEQEKDQLVNIKQAGEFLNLSVPTIYGLVQRASIPVYKVGKKLYFSKEELTTWIKAGRKLTNAEIESKATAYLTNLNKKR